MSQQDFDHLLDKYLSGNCSEQEEKIILEWYQTLIRESSLQLPDEQKRLIEDKIWSAVSANIQPFENKPKSKVVSIPYRKFYRLAIAVCFLLLVGIGVYWLSTKKEQANAFARLHVPDGYSQVTNNGNDAQDVQLSDGSIVTLESQATLFYPQTFQEDKRNVYLTGNAFFTVAHDSLKHFIVHTEEGLLTEVLGTSFSIIHKRQLQKIEVAVVSGRVLVYEQKSTDKSNIPENIVELTPNQKATYNPANKQLTASLVDEPKPLLNHDAGKSEFVFDETPIRQVLNSIEQAYGINIRSDKRIDNCHFTGDITKQGLFEKLAIVCQTIQCTYEIKGTEIMMKGSGCN